jgi:hypothetical protein
LSIVASLPPETGLEVSDIGDDLDFAGRKFHARNASLQVRGMLRLAKAFVENPDTVLQELVEAAVELCGADSAGISIERENRTDKDFYHWVATAGVYSGFLDAVLPKYPSACGVCLERGTPQHFRVRKEFFDILGVEAPLVADGILLPWEADGTRGTIFVMAHDRPNAFDGEDVQMMQVLANFAALGVRQQRMQKRLLEQAGVTAAAAMANELAHQINNPLQSVSNLMYIGGNSGCTWDANTLVRELSEPVERLSSLVGQLLSLPISQMRNTE